MPGMLEYDLRVIVLDPTSMYSKSCLTYDSGAGAVVAATTTTLKGHAVNRHAMMIRIRYFIPSFQQRKKEQCGSLRRSRRHQYYLTDVGIRTSQQRLHYGWLCQFFAALNGRRSTYTYSTHAALARLNLARVRTRTYLCPQRPAISLSGLIWLLYSHHISPIFQLPKFRNSGAPAISTELFIRVCGLISPVNEN